MIFWLDRQLAKLMILMLKGYQKTLSPDHGPLKGLKPYGFCRFHPTCSQYSVDCYDKYGFLKGSLKTIWRLLRCNPFNKGGYDPA